MSDPQQFDRGQFVQITGADDTLPRLVGRCGEIIDVFVSESSGQYFYDVKLAEEPEDTHWLVRQNSLRAIAATVSPSEGT